MNKSPQSIQQPNPFWGMNALIARRLGVTHEHVRQVALGNRVSRRVAKALMAEKKRRERRSGLERAA